MYMYIIHGTCTDKMEQVSDMNIVSDIWGNSTRNNSPLIIMSISGASGTSLSRRLGKVEKHCCNIFSGVPRFNTLQLYKDNERER